MGTARDPNRTDHFRPAPGHRADNQNTLADESSERVPCSGLYGFVTLHDGVRILLQEHSRYLCQIHRTLLVALTEHVAFQSGEIHVVPVELHNFVDPAPRGFQKRNDRPVSERLTLATLESTYNKLHEHDEAPVDLMHSPEWSARITEVRRVFVNAAKISTGYKVNATKANNGPTADMLVTLPDGTTKDATELTDDERANLCDATSVRGMMPVLQSMVDAVLYDTTGRDDGLNRYRVYTTDVRYMRDNVLTYNKKTHHTSEANLSTVSHLCFDVLARLVAGRAYVLDAANK